MGLRKYSKRYAEPVDLNTAPQWYRQKVAAAQRASAKQEKRKLIQSGWYCAREWNLSDRQKCFRCSGVRSDDAITRGMPRPSDTRAESDDESSDDDSDRDEMRRSIRESLVEARQILRPGGRKRGGKKHGKMALSPTALKERGEAFLQNEGRAGCKPSAGV